MASSLTILIVGGYGTFGGRIVELPEDEPRLTLIVAGRSREKAAHYCATRIHAAARLVPALFDRNGDSAGELSALQPDIGAACSSRCAAWIAPTIPPCGPGISSPKAMMDH